MTMKPWRENAIPHESVQKATFLQSEFAADLMQVNNGTATEEYQNPIVFFQRTFITEGMRLLLDSVIKRLAGRGGDPVIQLQTAFGGGKTHTMMAVYHLAKGTAPVSELQGISSILDGAGITELPKANIAVLDGNELAPNIPKDRNGLKINTLWGDLAWQLGGASAYERIREADISGTSPGKEVLAELLSSCAPCVILVDELVAYIRQFEEGRTFTGGTYDSNLSFIQALTEALKSVPTAVMLASLPESDKEAGSTRGVNALAALSHYFGRVHALWKPVATEEAFEIVRRRLFSNIRDEATKQAVCRAYADYYIQNSGDFPSETQEARYFERLTQAYPIHPEVFDRLYQDWSSLDNFQRTRGVLKLMAKVIHQLWKKGDTEPLISPGSLPLYDADTRNEVIYYLPQGWDPVLEGDVDGDRSQTWKIEQELPLFGSISACRRNARAVFLGSAPSTAEHAVRGVDIQRVMLGVAMPGQAVVTYKDALRRLVDRLHYLNTASDRYYFDTRANLRREMEDRKKRFGDKDDIIPVIREKVRSIVSQGVFSAVHVFTPSSDIPDDSNLRLVIMPPDVKYHKIEDSQWKSAVNSILQKRGEQPRQKQNRLIFMVADFDAINRLKDHVRTYLAWKSIVKDVEEMRLNLDQFQVLQAKEGTNNSETQLKSTTREAYKWLLSPMQDIVPGKGPSETKWEPFQLNTGIPILSSEIERVLKENELLITEWAPIHLFNMLKNWYWKDGITEAEATKVLNDTQCYLYLPRLKDEDVFRRAIMNGTSSKDFFGIAQGKEDGKYLGFSFGTAAMIVLKDLLLLEPKAAQAVSDDLLRVEEERKRKQQETDGNKPLYPEDGGDGTAAEPVSPTPAPKAEKRHFYANKELNSTMAKIEFNDIYDEIIKLLQKPEIHLEIKIDISATSTKPYDEGIMRSVKENCRALGFGNSEFEE